MKGEIKVLTKRKVYLKRELSALFNYVHLNLNTLVCALLFSIVIFWALGLFEDTLKIWFAKLTSFLPPRTNLIVFVALVYLATWKYTKPLYLRYRNSYFLERPNLLTIDLLILTFALPFYWLLIRLTEWGFNNLLALTISLPVYVTLSYIVAIYPLFLKDFLTFAKSDFKKDNLIELYPDEPINNETEDTIGRRNFAVSLKNHIYNLSFKQSFVIALYGQWGEGKTSIVNLLKTYIKEDNKLMLYEFDPWFFGNQDALTTNFYHGLEDLLKERFFLPRGIQNSLKFYPEILVKGFVGINFKFGDKNVEDRPLELKRNIEAFISSLDKRILVIIDDIDRLQKDEMLALFRLVKLTSRIKNIVFLLSFDYDQVVSVLSRDDGIVNPGKYLEKIIQLPISLPLTDQRKIDQFLLFSYPSVKHISEIDKLFDKLSISANRRKEFDEEFVRLYQSDLKQLFSTYRDTKRFLNGVYFRLPFIEREVYLYDFFVIEIFHTFFPNIYSDMKKHPWFYASPWSLEFASSTPLPYNDDQKDIAIKNHIDSLISNEENRSLLFSLLTNIFPEINNAIRTTGRGRTDYSHVSADYRNKKRVAHPDCYLKYFMLGVREGSTPDAEFEDELKKWSTSRAIYKTIEKSMFDRLQREFKLLDFIQFLKLNAGSLELKIIKPLIKVIYTNCDKFSKTGEFWSTEYDQAAGLIFRIFEDNRKISDNEIQPSIVNIIKHCKQLDFASKIILFTDKTRGGSLFRIYDHTDLDNLRGTLEKRLHKHFIKGKRNIFLEYKEEREFAFILYQWAIRWGDPKKHNREEVTDYILGLFKKNPKNAGFFLKHFVRDGFSIEENKYFDYTEFKVAYNPAKFQQGLVNLGEKAYSTEIEKEAIELFLKSHEEDLKKIATQNLAPVNSS